MSSGHARADDAAGDAAASVASGLRELVAASAEIVRVSVQHARSTEHRVGAEEGDQLVLALILGDAIGAGLDVAEVTDVTLLVLRATMRSVVRVVVGTGRFAPDIIQFVIKKFPLQFTIEFADYNIDGKRTVLTLDINIIVIKILIFFGM